MSEKKKKPPKLMLDAPEATDSPDGGIIAVDTNMG